MPLTVFAVATAIARNPAAVAGMKEAGWDIATHGLKWIDYKDFTKEDERAHIREAVRIHTEVTGSAPLGIYQGRTSAHTLDITMEEGGFLYSADSYADDLPYWVRGRNGPQLIVPYTLDANDMRFVTPQGFNSGDQFFAYLRDSFDLLYAEGVAGNPKMMSVGLHCRLAAGQGALRRSPASSITCRGTTGSGSRAGSTSLAIGLQSTPLQGDRAPEERKVSPARARLLTAQAIPGRPLGASCE